MLFPGGLEIALAVAGVGIAVGLAAFFGFRKAKTTVNPMAPQQSSALVVTGIYRWTRNPMYLGMLAVLVAWALWLANAAPFFLLPLFVALSQPFPDRARGARAARALRRGLRALLRERTPMAVSLFSPLDIGGITLPNRIVISPMCQYSADDGCMNDWHFVHLGHLAYSGAGLMILEATHVTREGRITHGCSGLYDAHNEAAMKRVIDNCRRLTKNAIGVQIGHAGRKASSQVPWEGREWLRPDQSPWQTVAPSPIPYGPGWHTPKELSLEEIKGLVDAFASSAERAKRIGFESVELHSAHGYLLHQFQSPLSNREPMPMGRTV